MVETGAGILGSGTHPVAEEGDAEITDKERYERIHFLLGDAAVTPVGGLHIHVGMPHAETAIKMTSLLTAAADVPDYTWFWWKLRPHPRLGTVEIRALDAQTSLADTAALVALVQCLARDAAEAAPAEDPPPELVEEGMFRAARFGVRGRLPDADGTLRAVPELLDEALARAHERAGELQARRSWHGSRSSFTAAGAPGRSAARTSRRDRCRWFGS